MDRYVTRWYVSTSRDGALRHAEIDHTPEAEIRHTENVEPVHVASSWILWSDRKFTTSIGGGLPKGGRLTAAAERLISEVDGSDTGFVEGGKARLAEIDQVLGTEVVRVGADRGHYASERVERYRVRWRDGHESDLFVHSAGYFEGYQLDVYDSLESLQRQARPSPGPEGLTGSLEDMDYDPELGYVKSQDA